MANNVAYTGNNRATFCSPVKDPFVIVANLLLLLLLLLAVVVVVVVVGVAVVSVLLSVLISVLLIIVDIIIISIIVCHSSCFTAMHAVKQKLVVELYIPLAGCRILSSSVGKEAE